MGGETNKQLIHRFLKEVMQNGKIDLIPEFVSESFEDRSAVRGLPATGHAAVESFVLLEQALLPDRQIEIVYSIAEDDIVVVLTRTSGTHSGELLGIPPSGQQLTLTSIHMLKVESGKFVEHWRYGDLIEQLSTVSS